MKNKILTIGLVLIIGLGLIGCNGLEESHEGKYFILSYPEG